MAAEWSNKMKKILSVALILSTLLCIFSCGNKKSDIPAGMQIVRGGENIGYYFYAPEEWQISNVGNISSAYASNVDTTSVSYTEVTPPEGTAYEYFHESLKEFPTAPELTVDGKETTFGNADSALMFVYEHTYTGHKFRTMQILVSYKERFGIFTYTSVLEKISSDELQYDYYKEKIDNVMSVFKFVDKSGTVNENKYENTPDGYMLISDMAVAKFSLFVPSDMTVNFSSGISSASFADGSTLTLSRAIATGVVVSDYWENRKTELKEIVTELNVIEENKNTVLGNSKRAYAYEYTYVYNGSTYHVYQILGITTFNGFVFTYTAKEDNYSLHMPQIEKIIEISDPVYTFCEVMEHIDLKKYLAVK